MRRTGRSLALVAGDLLFTAALETLHDVDLPATLIAAAPALLAHRHGNRPRTGMDIAVSQASGAACEKTLLREYHWKTAAYTFEGPMLSGAILAGRRAGSSSPRPLRPRARPGLPAPERPATSRGRPTRAATWSRANGRSAAASAVPR